VAKPGFKALGSGRPDSCYCALKNNFFSALNAEAVEAGYTHRNENFVLVRSNRAITVAAQNRRLALVTNILSRDSHGAVPVADGISRATALGSVLQWAGGGMADTLVLGTSAFGRESSSLSWPTNN